jgi:D-alanine-D-alanine ligase
MQTLPSSLRIGVLRGGPSLEYDLSLKSGGHVLAQLAETHRPIDIFISKDGRWHMHGVEKSPERILKHVDVVFNALHGEYGEDGVVQEILGRHGMPHTGADRLSSSIAMNKWMTKMRAQTAGIKTPLYSVVKREDSLPEKLAEKVREISSVIPYPMIVKPVSGGFSHGVYFVQSHSELFNALESVLYLYPSAMVEEYISGKEVSCTTLNDFRGEKTYAFPPIEIKYSPLSPVWRHEMKHYSDTDFIHPTTLSKTESKKVEDMTKNIHKALGLHSYSQSDFIVSPRRGVYFLEVNTSPDVSDKSLVHKSLEAVGSSMKEFLHHVLGLALERK